MYRQLRHLHKLLHILSSRLERDMHNLLPFRDNQHQRDLPTLLYRLLDLLFCRISLRLPILSHRSAGVNERALRRILSPNILLRDHHLDL